MAGHTVIGCYRDPDSVGAVRLGAELARHLVERSEAYDALFCGSHGRGRLASAVLGSGSGRLVRAAHSAVIVVPPLIRRRSDGPLGLTTAAG